MVTEKISKETKNHFVDRTYQIQPKPVMQQGKWIEQEPMYLVYEKTWRQKPFSEQEWTEKISKEEFKERLRKCTGELT